MHDTALGDPAIDATDPAAAAPTQDQRLWLLTAHPDTWGLGEAPDRLIAGRQEKGLVASMPPSVSKLTTEGHKH